VGGEGNGRYAVMADVDAGSVAQVSKHEFFFELPLYATVRLDDLESDFGEGAVDARSPQNQIETTYKIERKNLEASWPWLESCVAYELTCVRRGERLVFFVLESDELIAKVGQFPSLADMQYAELGRKYDKLLGSSDLALFKKAIGLAAHSAGAGAFVYLRRIFEKLIRETYDAHQTELNVTSEEFTSMRMADKVKALKQYLPTELVAMKPLYSILSSGVHELTEKQCLTYFPALKLSIELILDQKIEKAHAQKRKKEVLAQVQNISQELAKQ
jgi:hypothetical protein